MHCKKVIQLSKKELEAVCEQVLFTDNGFHLKIIFLMKARRLKKKPRFP